MDLREYRVNQGLEQAQAAKKAKVSAPAFCSVELGSRWASPITILKIMIWSGGAVTAADLLQAWCRRHKKKYPGA